MYQYPNCLVANKLLMMRYWLISALLLATCQLRAQDSIWKQKPELRLAGFLEVFYAYDFNKPQGNSRQPFLYNHNRHNEFNLNLGYVKLGLEHTKYRANLALHAGTYVNDNYAAEPGVLKHVFEANVGLSLNKTNKLWLDAGIFASHIGFESAVSIDNWTLTRSLLAENSPYFLSGAKLTYTPNSKWAIAALVCNGWQRIQRLQGNSLPSFGTQLTYSPTAAVSFNWSTFIGTDDPDSTRRMRYFNNLYGKFQIGKKFGLIAGFDIGVQQQRKASSSYHVWFSPVLIAQYRFTPKWVTALRAEYYQDRSGVIIPSLNPDGFAASGLSLNVDYTPIPIIACRIEGRWLGSIDNLFERNNNLTNNNFALLASIAVKLQR
jgi:hypothetical protein